MIEVSQDSFTVHAIKKMRGGGQWQHTGLRICGHLYNGFTSSFPVILQLGVLHPTPQLLEVAESLNCSLHQKNK